MIIEPEIAEKPLASRVAVERRSTSNLRVCASQRLPFPELCMKRNGCFFCGRSFGGCAVREPPSGPEGTGAKTSGQDDQQARSAQETGPCSGKILLSPAGADAGGRAHSVSDLALKMLVASGQENLNRSPPAAFNHHGSRC